MRTCFSNKIGRFGLKGRTGLIYNKHTQFLRSRQVLISLLPLFRVWDFTYYIILCQDDVLTYSPVTLMNHIQSKYMYSKTLRLCTWTENFNKHVKIVKYTLISIMSHHPFHQKVWYKQGVAYLIMSHLKDLCIYMWYYQRNR